MDALLETLNAKLSQWKPETAAQVRERIAEIISLADRNALEPRSRPVEPEVLDISWTWPDDPPARVKSKAKHQ